ncbi:MAG TPA: enoyl-CoA hydratase/isomerase family protein [Pyrinomonadaceae bacterium]|nr:enoyl-CoA hydratase/isomerase family protein [Pyrinomonadaceae bacterium]
MPEDSPSIVTLLDDSVALIRFNIPAQRNSLSLATLHNLQSALSELIVVDEIKTIILTGTADVFASGADLRELSQLDRVAALEFSQLGQRLFQTIADAKQLTIAAINGYCMGGGLDLALACKIRVASPNAIFAHPGVRLGIITGWGGTQRLPRIIGRTRAMELMLTGRSLGSEAALSIGLVTRVEDPILACALAISHGSPSQVTLNR